MNLEIYLLWRKIKTGPACSDYIDLIHGIP